MPDRNDDLETMRDTTEVAASYITPLGFQVMSGNDARYAKAADVVFIKDGIEITIKSHVEGVQIDVFVPGLIFGWMHRSQKEGIKEHSRKQFIIKRHDPVNEWGEFTRTLQLLLTRHDETGDHVPTFPHTGQVLSQSSSNAVSAGRNKTKKAISNAHIIGSAAAMGALVGVVTSPISLEGITPYLQQDLAVVDFTAIKGIITGIHGRLILGALLGAAVGVVIAGCRSAVRLVVRFL